MATPSVPVSPPPPTSGQASSATPAVEGAASPTGEAAAKQYMQDNFEAYTNRNHPKHADIDAEVKRLWKSANPPEVPTPEPPPKPAADPVADWRKAVDQGQPDQSAPPMPKALRDVIPDTSRGYELLTPGTKAEGPRWHDPGLQQYLDHAAFPAKLNNGQASDALNLEATLINSTIQERGMDGLADEVTIGKLITWATQRGWSREQFERVYMWRLDRLHAENLARIRRGLPPLGEAGPPVAAGPDATEDEVKQLMADPQGPYRDASRHSWRAVQQARAKVTAYFARKAKGGGK